jgi:galactose-1-phosphate uridylyltransferase
MNVNGSCPMCDRDMRVTGNESLSTRGRCMMW